MKKYKANYIGLHGFIECIEITRETAETVIWAGRRQIREQKVSPRHRYFDSFGEAKAHLACLFSREVAAAESLVLSRRKRLAEVESMTSAAERCNA